VSGVCDGPIPCPKETYRVCVIECEQVQRLTLYAYTEYLGDILRKKG